LKSIFVTALILLLVIPLFSILVPRAKASDYPHDPRGEITDVDIVWSTCYQGETQGIYVVFRNPTLTTYPYVVSVTLFDLSNNVVYDSHQVGQDIGGYVNGGQSVTWGPWWCTVPTDAPNGTYHVLARLKLYPWTDLDYRGLSWCEPEATFLAKLSHETIFGHNGAAYDSDEDGCNDTAWVQVLAMTNCQQDVNVWAGAVFKDPNGNVASVHSTNVWTVPAAGKSWSDKVYFNVPAGSPVGNYSVDLYLFDTSHRNGDDPEHVLQSAQTYNPLCPPGYGKSSLSNGYVDPASGSTSTVFSYYVTYSGSVAPTEKQVCIDGSDWHTMSLYNGSASNGVYGYQLTLPAGSHNFYFKFSDGTNTATLPTTGSISGPMVGTTWFNDAWLKNKIDNDGDGLYGQFDLCWNVDTKAQQLAVYVKLFGRQNGGAERFIGWTYMYMIYGQQAETYIVTLVAGPGTFGSWDFKLELYDANNSLLSALGYGQDSDITGVPVDDNDRVPATFTLTISASSGGTTTPPPGVYSCATFGGLVINVSANPYANYFFDHWELNGVNVGSTNPINVTLDRNLDLHAVFVPLAYNVTIVGHCDAEGVDVGVAITEDGTLTGLTTPYTFTGLTGSHSFAVPGVDVNGHAFMNWSTGEGTVTMSVLSGGTYTAYYGASPPPTYNVTIVGHCDAEGVDVGVAITEDGTLTGLTTPYTFTGLTGSHSFAVPGVDVNGHALKQWSTGSTSTTIAVSSGGTYTAYYEQVSGPIISIIPSSGSVKVGQNVTIAVKVSNVTNLYTWQITLHFNSSIVECAGAWYPDDHVFAGRPFIPVTPSIGQDNMELGASLVGSGRFDGSGTLCLINFTGLAQGSCPLQFDAEGTFLLDSDLNSIHITIIQGSLTVSGEHTLTLGGRATDVDGSGKVDMKDLGLVCHVFNTSPEDPSWNRACDVNHDSRVDMKDIGLVAHDFGKAA